MLNLAPIAEPRLPTTFRSRRDSQERRRAAQIQRTFLPDLNSVPVPGYTFSEYFRPVDELGGDFYDVFHLGNGQVAFYLADVSGHDMGAALVTVWLRQLLQGFRSQDLDLIRSPAKVFEAVQRNMASDHLDSTFLTMVYGILDRHTGQVRYATAGHPTPIVLSNSGHIRCVVNANGPILSSQFGPDIGWTEGSTLLEPGDGLLLFSDGVLDVRNSEGRVLGRGNFQSAALAGLADERSAPGIAKAVHRIAGGGSAEDDITLLLLMKDSKE